MATIGHRLVKPDWNRFNPTNGANKYQQEFTQVPRASEASANAPPSERKPFSTVNNYCRFLCYATTDPGSAQWEFLGLGGEAVPLITVKRERKKEVSGTP